MLIINRKVARNGKTYLYVSESNPEQDKFTILSPISKTVEIFRYVRVRDPRSEEKNELCMLDESIQSQMRRNRETREWVQADAAVWYCFFDKTETESEHMVGYVAIGGRTHKLLSELARV